MTGRALITGGEGFVGRILAEHLGRNGWEVVPCSLEPEADMLTCNVTDRRQVEAALDAAGAITHVFHLAGISFVPDAAQDPALAFRVNTMGTVHLGEMLRARGFNGRLIVIGSAEMYGPPESLPITESHPLRPENPYGASKVAADLYAEWVGKLGAIDVVRMRPFNHSGPSQLPRFVLPAFAKQAAEIAVGLIPPRMRVGNLEAKRDFLHVRDVVRAYELAALRGVSGAAYNISSGNAYRIADALQHLISRAGKDIEVVQDPALMRPLVVPELRGSFEALQRDTGWRPEIPFETLLDELFDAWRDKAKQA